MAKKTTNYLKDYQPSTFDVKTVELLFDIEQNVTNVHAKLHIVPKTQATCTLAGSAELCGIKLNSRALDSSEYTLLDNNLTLTKTPDQPFVLDIHTRLFPSSNHSCMGLYESGGNLYTQCEPEGFRKITYYFDRPDVLSVFTTTITADQAHYPVLLSNGNLVSEIVLDNGKHQVVWHDPFPKSAYLFALVAGSLSVQKDTFTTKSGRTVNLHFYTRKEDAGKVDFALQSLKHAMKWDETRFDLEYDLDTYMVVAVSDFNMGAMENKGLNLFNTLYVLANTFSATDADFEGIEAVIAHEYFHNWTGNRVTCRDWFQLSLKEGLTVFRDQEFSGDRAEREVRRIRNVRVLRARQFAEDAGPTAHPVRPESYEEINNFYTYTVYEKGAEVVRIYHSLLGEQGFLRGMKLYFERHDGQAVTCEDFLNAMADANNTDLSAMKVWYRQAGTVQVAFSARYIQETQQLELTFSQHTAPTPGQAVKENALIPIKIALVGEGQLLPFTLQDSDETMFETVLRLENATQTFTLNQVPKNAVPSIFREFSAPVRFNPTCHHLSENETIAQLLHLIWHDNDAFVRWNALQILYTHAIEATYRNDNASETLHNISRALLHLLKSDINPALMAELLTLPASNEVWEGKQNIRPAQYENARLAVWQALAKTLEETLKVTLSSLLEREAALENPHDYSPEGAGLRSLIGVARAWLMKENPVNNHQLIAGSYPNNAPNMTHELSILQAINHTNTKERQQCLAIFEERHKDDDLAMDKYFSLIASAAHENTLEDVKNALNHPLFKRQNPNKLRALLGQFTRNHRHFHTEDGAAYRFLCEQIALIDGYNPQIAALLLQGFTLFPALESTLQQQMKSCLSDLASRVELSSDSAEIVRKILA